MFPVVSQINLVRLTIFSLVIIRVQKITSLNTMYSNMFCTSNVRRTKFCKSIYFYFLSFTLTLLSLLVEIFFCLSQYFDLNVQIMFNHPTNVSTILIKFVYQFSYASALDKLFLLTCKGINISAYRPDFIQIICNNS